MALPGGYGIHGFCHFGKSMVRFIVAGKISIFLAVTTAQAFLSVLFPNMQTILSHTRRSQSLTDKVTVICVAFGDSWVTVGIPIFFLAQQHVNKTVCTASYSDIVASYNY